MARLFADENFPLPVVEALRKLDHDAITIQDAGKGEQALPDEAVLALAHADSRVLLTLNRRHFIQLHKAEVPHSGIVVCTYDPDFFGQADRVHEALRGSESLQGRLIRVNRPQR